MILAFVQRSLRTLLTKFGFIEFQLLMYYLKKSKERVEEINVAHQEINSKMTRIGILTLMK